MGIPGLILAPVVLNYLRVEMLTVEVPARHEEVEVVESLNVKELHRFFLCNLETFTAV